MRGSTLGSLALARGLHRLTPKEGVMLDALLPEALALVPRLEEKFNRILKNDENKVHIAVHGQRL